MSAIELDPRILGQRIAEARKARGKTQKEVAEFLGLSRPTYIAIEKGERRAKDDEILKLALFLGRTVNELVRRVEPVTDLQPHFRAVAEKSKSGVRDSAGLSGAIEQFQSLAEDYRELERMMNAPLRMNYPAELVLNPKIDPVEQAEVAAAHERKRLGIGGPTRRQASERAGVGHWPADFLLNGPSIKYRRAVRLLGGARGMRPH